MTHHDILTAIQTRQSEVEDRLASLKEEVMSLSLEVDELHTAKRVVQRLASLAGPTPGAGGLGPGEPRSPTSNSDEHASGGPLPVASKDDHPGHTEAAPHNGEEAPTGRSPIGASHQEPHAADPGFTQGAYS